MCEMFSNEDLRSLNNLVLLITPVGQTRQTNDLSIHDIYRFDIPGKQQIGENLHIHVIHSHQNKSTPLRTL